MRFLTRRRVLIGLPILLLVLFGLWSGWRAYQVYGDLSAAERAAREAMAAAQADDEPRLAAAVAELQSHASSAADGTGGPTWWVLSKVPFIGDDASGVQALSESLDLIGRDAAEPLTSTYGTLRELNVEGRIDLAGVRAMQEPVRIGGEAIGQAAETLHGQDTSGFMDPLRGRYEEFTEIVDGLDGGMSAARDASLVLPDALGGSGSRDYLLVFLNNAEIRSSGGMPGAYAHVRATDGELELLSQGGPGDLGGPPAQSVLPLSKAEESFFGEQLGIYFQDANFIQDMPRTAELMAARWKLETGGDLAGVLTLDTVGMSYLLDGAGPVTTPDGVQLTEQNAVSELLNATYRKLPDPEDQDARFAQVAASMFKGVTTEVRDPMALLKGLGRAGSEGRLLVNLFDDEQQKVLTGRRIAGELTTAAKTSPEVDLGFDDATASKMSYYLRYRPTVQSVSCTDGVQRLSARMRVSSELTAAEAASLPASIVNDGQMGTEPGSQLPFLRIYGPTGGTVTEVRVDGQKVDVDTVDLNGRPAVSLALLLAPGQANEVTWQMTSGPGQTGPVDLGVTPGIESGDQNALVASTCS